MSLCDQTATSAKTGSITEENAPHFLKFPIPVKDKTSIPKDLLSYHQFAGEKSKTLAESGWNASYGKCYLHVITGINRGHQKEKDSQYQK